MSTDTRVACPDPNCKAHFRISRCGTRRFSHAVAQGIHGEHMIRYTREVVRPRLAHEIDEARADRVAALRPVALRPATLRPGPVAAGAKLAGARRAG